MRTKVVPLLSSHGKKTIKTCRSLWKTIATIYLLVFSIAKFHTTSIKSYWPPTPVNEQIFALAIIKKANQFISIKFFFTFQQLDGVTFLGGATSDDSNLSAYKTPKIVGFFFANGSITKLRCNTEHCPFEGFHSKLRGCNVLDTVYNDKVNPLKSGLTTEQAVIK